MNGVEDKKTIVAGHLLSVNFSPACHICGVVGSATIVILSDSDHLENTTAVSSHYGSTKSHIERFEERLVDGMQTCRKIILSVMMV